MRFHRPFPRFTALLPALVWVVLALASATLPSGRAWAAEGEQFIRIATGPLGGTYFPIGGLIAHTISNPPGSVPCDAGGSCGVPGLIAASVASQGSIDNVGALTAGQVQLGLSQADVARDAFDGSGVFAGKPPLSDLRSVANLFAESVHVVVRKESPITGIADLKGKRVALGEQRSGTFATAKTVLSGYRLAPNDMVASADALTRATGRLAAGEIDALVMVGGYPLEAIARLADTVAIRLLPIDGKPAETILERDSTLAASVIPAGTYPGTAETRTVGPRAQLLTSAKVSAELIYAITKALWNPRNRLVLDSSHPEGRAILEINATEGLVVPLHPGAARYYGETNPKRDGRP
ncbi:MAG: TAXI family TRAP transporter solute-binding subunit [Rhodospirillales bacterium]